MSKIRFLDEDAGGFRAVKKAAVQPKRRRFDDDTIKHRQGEKRKQSKHRQEQYLGF